MSLAGETVIAHSKEYAFTLLDDLEKYEIFPHQRVGKELLIDEKCAISVGCGMRIEMYQGAFGCSGDAVTLPDTWK